jgi:hypothetical protein
MQISATDLKLLRALVHDAQLRSDSANEIDVVHKLLGIADSILCDVVTDEERTSARQLLHPQVVSLYLDS